MQACEHILAYLGFANREVIGGESKFMYLIKRCKAYADVGRDDNISDEEIKAETVLETLVDPIVNELFIRIIRIINFFCKEFYKLEIERKN